MVASQFALESLPFIRLTAEEIQKAFDPRAFNIYDAKPVQCKTCSQRFEDSLQGRKQFQDHMDWHFRRNRRLKDKDQRVSCRDIFSSEKVHTYFTL